MQKRVADDKTQLENPVTSGLRVRARRAFNRDGSGPIFLRGLGVAYFTSVWLGFFSSASLYRITSRAYIRVYTHALVIAAAGLRRPYLLRPVSRRPASPRVVSVPRSTLDWPRVRTWYRTNELWSLFVDLHTDSLCAGGTENWNATWRNRIAGCMWNVEGGRQQKR